MKIFKGGFSMLKRFILTVILILSVSVPATAMDLKLSEEWSAHAVSGVVFAADDANSQFTGGIFVGPIVHLKTDLGKNIMGFGGLIGNVKTDEDGIIKGAGGITVVTIYDDMIQASIVVDPTQYKWIDPDTYMVAITFQPIGALETVGGTIASVFGMITGN